MRGLIITSLLLAACGTEETVTTTTTPETQTPKKTTTTQTPKPAAEQTQTKTEVVVAPTAEKPYSLKFIYKTGDERVGIVDCVIDTSYLLEWSMVYSINEATFKLKAQEAGCSLNGASTVVCNITDNYTEATAECGARDNVTGGRLSRKQYKVYTAPDLSAWKS